MSLNFRLSELLDISNVAIITLGERGYRVKWDDLKVRVRMIGGLRHDIS